MINYTKLLHDELIPAFGCTDPLSIAFAAAKATKVLGIEPIGIRVYVSGNLIKNARSVIIPGTGGLKGVDIASTLGAIAGDSNLGLEVLKNITSDDAKRSQALLKNGFCKVFLAEVNNNLYIKIVSYSKDHDVSVTLLDDYNRISEIKKDDETIFSQEFELNKKQDLPMNFDSIFTYVNNVKINKVKELLDRQINFNLNIAKEGLAGNWGANIGKLIIKENGSSITNMAIAHAAAGSDARMGGCSLPVIINSGSGNQGLTISIPIIILAEHLKTSQSRLYRALILGNLLSIYLRKGIGRLSAYCGVVSAASASLAGIAFLYGESKKVIEETLTNSLVSSSGMLCDGAKPSCALKIATSLNTALLGYKQAKNNLSFKSGDGIMQNNVDATIGLVSTIAKEGMKEADYLMINSMISE